MLSRLSEKENTLNTGRCPERKNDVLTAMT